MTTSINIDGIIINDPRDLKITAVVSGAVKNGIRIYRPTGHVIVRAMASDLFGNIVLRMGEHSLADKKKGIQVSICANNGVYKYKTTQPIRAVYKDGYTTINMKCKQHSES